MPDQPIPPSWGISRQMGIYMEGLNGKLPSIPLSYEELERQAQAKMTPQAYGYVAGSAGEEDTARANRDAFKKWRIVPRFLRNVLQRDLSVELFGHRLASPLLLGPVGVLSIVHPEAEVAVAKAAAQLNMTMILSTAASKSIEEVGTASGYGHRWFQLYWPAKQEMATSFVQRAENAGYSAIVVTLDTYLLAWRERDLQNAYLPFLQGMGLANYFTDPMFQQMVGGDPLLHPIKAIETFGQVFSNPALTWDHLKWLREQTKLPILLKGVLHPDDARKAIDLGMSGIIVSNHGGRQLDGAIATLDALPGVVDAVQGKMPVLFDSGIRRGSDVVKALCLGAKAVLVARPYAYGLALDGSNGIVQVMSNLLADFDLSLGLMGCKNLGELNRDCLVQ
ncbi:MAG TPA: lactate 2-monooxygenase [Gemmatales bacterium]|nr:lactate 2-monooxygenase [Gemmatales bacterium]